MNTANERMITEHRRGRVIASPRARRAMRERGVDPAAIRGSGPGGRIVEADVLRASAGSGDPRRAPKQVSGTFSFWLQATADVTSLVSIQGEVDEEVQRACGTPLRLADLLLRAMVMALADCPEANCVWRDETPVAQSTADVGFEVEVPGGRVTAVIRQADRLRLLDLVSRRAGLVKAAQAGRLPPEAAQGAATSLCDLSDYQHVDRCAATLLPPFTSILAAGRPALRPWIFGPEKGTGPFCLKGPKGASHKMDLSPFPAVPFPAVCPRQTLSLCLTADRRAVPPEAAAKLLGRIVEFLERPLLLLCERQPR